MRLTDKQRLFCHFFLESNNATEAALKAGYLINSAHVTASRMLKDAKIIQYMAYLQATIEEIFIKEAKNSLATIIELRDDRKQSGTVRLKACQDILDRAGYKATDKIKLYANVEHSGSVASTQEYHIIQELVNTNEELADAIIQSIRQRNNPVVIPDDAEEE